MTEAYDRQELERLGDEFPMRGPVCPKCKVHVPQFATLDRDVESRVRNLMWNNEPTLAIDELRAATGCSARWAKIWVLHRGGPPWPIDPLPTPCPHCSGPLRTARAQQCRHCGLDWHNNGNEAV